VGKFCTGFLLSNTYELFKSTQIVVHAPTNLIGVVYMRHTRIHNSFIRKPSCRHPHAKSMPIFVTAYSYALIQFTTEMQCQKLFEVVLQMKSTFKERTTSREVPENSSFVTHALVVCSQLLDVSFTQYSCYSHAHRLLCLHLRCLPPTLLLISYSANNHSGCPVTAV
jgi:hypothetical protein